MVRKGRGNQDRKLRRNSEVPKCYIFCEGDMEEEYLNFLDDRVVNIILEPRNLNTTDPNAIYEEAKLFMRTHKFNKEVDRCIIIVDADRLSSRGTSRVTRGRTTLTVEGYRCLCRDSSILLILNSPDLEKWLGCHFKRNKFPEFYQKKKGDIDRLFEAGASLKKAYECAYLRNIEDVEYSEMYKLLDLLVRYDSTFLDKFK